MSEPHQSAAEIFASWASGLSAGDVPGGVRTILESVIIDQIGLCVVARDADFVRSVLASTDTQGACTVIGQGRTLDPAGAAFVNGTAAHGEDFDDTFEGTPVHCGSVVAPAVLAACEARRRNGGDALRGIAAGIELMCRLALVAPTAVHRAGFHPTAVIGALGAAAGVSVALGLDAGRTASAIGIAGSFASGLIEYLAEGAWTKRFHAGWAAQSGLRAARLAQEGFAGPRTVIEGTHGFFHGFADDSIPRDYSYVTERLGELWWAEKVAFKPYACGTMAQPFIDCAIALRSRKLDLAEIESIHCTVGEGTVHRLWEPKEEKAAPSTTYSAKFSVPYCIAVALVDGAAGLAQFSENRLADPAVRQLAAAVVYEIDPEDEYPDNYTGHIEVRLKNGETVEAEQPHLRGGKHEPLSRDEILDKMQANVVHGGWREWRAREVEVFCAGLFDAGNLSGLKAFRS